MEGLERMVSESFSRHGVEPEFDYRRVQWSRWFRCPDSPRLVLMSQQARRSCSWRGNCGARHRPPSACWHSSRYLKPMT